MNLKARYEGDSSHYSFKRSVPGAFNVGLIGSTCTALPGVVGRSEGAAPADAAAGWAAAAPPPGTP